MLQFVNRPTIKNCSRGGWFISWKGTMGSNWNADARNIHNIILSSPVEECNDRE